MTEKKVLILGVNGFIGHFLVDRILRSTNWQVYGMDVASDKLFDHLNNPNFHFIEGDITVNKEWIQYHIKRCDVILPLVAIATPALYVKEPLRVFSLDFEANLEIIRHVVAHKKRLIFPSTSEVYGMSEDLPFNENTSRLVLGPINKQRWIYSCSKQLLDRVIYAYGVEENLDYTLIRPFNWIGPRLDNINEEKEGSTRVLTQFIGNIIRKRSIKLVNGGEQCRSFTFIEDGIDAMMTIIENKDNCASQKIFNLGNPDNNYSIKELAERTLDIASTYAGYEQARKTTPLEIVTPDSYYGKHYEDTQARVPDITIARECLGWVPKTSLDEALKITLDYHLRHPAEDLGDETQMS